GTPSTRIQHSPTGVPPAADFSGRCRQEGMGRLCREVNGSPSRCENGSRGAVRLAAGPQPLLATRWDEGLQDMQGTGDSKTPNTRARDQRIRAHLDLVKSMARDIGGRPLGRGIDLDDLVGYGTVGLVEAATRFEERGVPFSAFARPRIYGAIVDGIRAQHWLGRRADRRLRVDRVGYDWQVAVDAGHRAHNDVRRNGRPMVCPPIETADVTEQVAAA